MNPDLRLALQITLVGMSLVFAAILLLWALMVALVRFAPEAQAPAERATPDGEGLPAPGVRAAADHLRPEPADGRLALRRQAAAVAVAVTLASEAHSPAPAGGDRPAGMPATAFVSAWQGVMRANQLRQRGPRR